MTGIVIPAGVASIGNSASYSCKNLATAAITTGLTNIGDHAFYECYNLTSAITLGDSLHNRGDFAFYYCWGLASVTIGNGANNIGNSAFAECWGLTNVNLGRNLTSIGDSAFYDCARLTNFTIPAGVTNLGNYAFIYCDSLSAITIPNGITSIGVSVLQDCSALKWVVLPAGITSLGYSAFMSSGQTNVIFPAGVTHIGAFAFCYCHSFKNIFFQGNAPAKVDGAFMPAPAPTVFILPGTTGWPAFTAKIGISVTAWLLPNPTILNFEPSFGMMTNQFGFTISWATNISVVVEAGANFANPVWQSVQTNTLTGGTAYFSYSQWTNFPGRFYRLHSP